MPQTFVVNIKTTTDYDVYIGRGSLFGNPFDYIKLGITRDECIEMYKKWFYSRLTDTSFRDKVFKLKGKRLGCYCKPLACHGDVICNFLNEDKKY